MTETYETEINEIKFRSCFEAAIRGHAHQFDKSRRPYIQHLLRVSGSVEPKYVYVAMLHDYFEDVHKTTAVAEMRKSFPYLEEVEIEALHLLTRPAHITYREFIQRIRDSGNEYAIAVKIADIEDHLSYGVIDHSLATRYNDAVMILMS